MGASAPVVVLRILRDLPDPQRLNTRTLLIATLTITLLAVMLSSNELVLGQPATADKSNEVKAISRLLARQESQGP